MYVLNNTDSDLKYKFKGSVYVFLANRIAQVDNTEISIADLKSAFGESSVTELTSLTQAQGGLLDSAIKETTSLSSTLKTLIDSKRGTSSLYNAYELELEIQKQALNESGSSLAIGESADSANTDSTSATASLMANVKGLLEQNEDIKTSISNIEDDIASLLEDTWVVTAAGTGTGNGSAQSVTATGRIIIITNKGLSDLTLTVGGIAVSVASGQTLPLRFSEFSSFTITAVASNTYNYIVGG